MKFLITLFAFLATTALHADPQLTSWYTANSGKYGRIYTSATNRTNGVSTPTWTSQTSPAYVGVNEINFSPSWVYIRNTGLGSHVMGPWQNPNLPKNQGTIYRFPRTPVIPGTKTLTNNGAIGFLVDGVSIYNTSDGFTYSAGNIPPKDATPNGGIGNGDGIWNRDAFPNELVSFDFALAHNPPSGQYHSHVNPIATRYLLGDNVLYAGTPENNSPKTYSENTATTTFQHSPIIGWLQDGLPLYGPYGYDGGSTGAAAVANLSGASVAAVSVTAGGTLYQSEPAITFTGGGGSGAAAMATVTGGVITAITVTNGGSGYTSAPVVAIGGVRRIISGYQLRDGTNGTTNIPSTGRTTLPAWAAAAQNRSATLSSGQYGPTTTYTSTNPTLTYTLGHYAEDYDYLGDLSYTQGSRSNTGGVFFDLNKYNARFCVTPEFPSGTWAYFTTIKADGTSFYPYTVGRWYHGAIVIAGQNAGTTNTTVMNADTPLTQFFLGGANTALTVAAPTVAGSTVSLTWSSVEGGTYSVDASPNQSGWTSEATGLVATGIMKSTSYTALGTSGTEYARVNRTALAAYDATGQTAATVAQSTIKSYALSNTPPTITTIADQTILKNAATSALAFTVYDAETALNSLTVSGSSSNTTLVPNANIVFGGSGGSRTATVTPAADHAGTATITVNVSDGTASTGTTFVLTVDDPPTITGITNQTIVQNTATSVLGFTVGDAETGAGSLTVSASSSNTTLVPNANIVLGGSGASRSVTITPATGQIGTATITVTVNDGVTTTNTTFTLTVTLNNNHNILLIIADDYGIDASSLYNTSGTATLPPTPQIATLAANGVRFTSAYAYPVCSPSRACMLTGRFGFRTGVGEVVSTAANNSLGATEFTLPDAFAANSALGYELKHFGKWHLTAGTGQSVNMSPCTVGGWPSYAGAIPGALNSYISWTKVVTNGTPAGTSSSTVTTYATTDIVNDAASWIQTQTLAGKPWFAWVAFNAPHTPFHLPSPTSLCPHYTGLSGTTADINAHPLNYYNAAVEAMDTEIGRLLAPVDLTRTTVIFLGDNGTPAQVVQTPFPSGHGKDTLYEGGIRVPLIVRGPDVVSPGRTSDVLTHVVDLYSTILEAAGIPIAGTVPSGVAIDSQSLLPVLQNQAVTRTRLYTEQFDTSAPTTGGVVLRDDRYKLIRNKTGTDEFYDLQTDPYESTNLFAAGVGGMTSTQQSYYYRLRYNLGRYTTATTPVASGWNLAGGSFSVTVPQIAGSTQNLWRCTNLVAGFWAPVSGATSSVNGTNVTFTDPARPSTSAYYSVVAETP